MWEHEHPAVDWASRQTPNLEMEEHSPQQMKHRMQWDLMTLLYKYMLVKGLS